MGKLMSAKDAINLIKDGDTVCVGGFVGCMHPEELTKTLEENYIHSGHPAGLTVVFAAGQGDGISKGINHFGHKGLTKRAIGGHWSLAPKLQKLAMDNEIEAYNLPQGVICHLFRDIAAGKPGTLTHVGLNTFVDPLISGGKLNDITKEDLVSRIQINSKDYLLYKSFKTDIALVRATYADTDGNATFEREVVSLETLAICQAVKNSGGKVILQVENVVKKGTLNTRLVKIPGFLVDAIVLASTENHMQTFGTQYNPAFSGEIVALMDNSKFLKLDVRKVICRRAAMELENGNVTNLGIGMPEGIAKVMAEEGQEDRIALTVESGPIGGVPASGNDFGASMNPVCILDSPSQFDFYSGGGLDIAFLGLAQTDRNGNVNVSKFGPKIAGCGGFIDITQNAKKVVYCGTFTAGGTEMEISNKQLNIISEGNVKKLVTDVDHITFSGNYAMEKGQTVLFITERAVFKLTDKGMILIEIAPGVDLERDILQNMAFKPGISQELKLMDEALFCENKMNLIL